MVLSVVILQLVSTGVNLLRMDPFFIQAMWGFIIIALIAVNLLSARLGERRRLKAALAEREGADGRPGRRRKPPD
jgi:simple sugar transport system permease protein